MGLGAAHHPACFTALLVPGWVKPSWKLGWGIGLEEGWAPLGASHPLWPHCAPFWPAFRSRALCAREGTPLGPRLCV